jgi:hypothetical protein
MLGSVLESIPANWRRLLAIELADPRVVSLESYVANQRAAYDVCPPRDQIFAALKLTPMQRFGPSSSDKTRITAPGTQKA